MKTLFSILALCYMTSVIAQEKTANREYYLTKSKNQKTAGYILAGIGAALIISGAVVGNDDGNNDPNELDFGTDFDAGVWLIGGGIASGIASIPFFISSGKNAKKAASIGIHLERIQLPPGIRQANPVHPGIALRVRL